MKIAVRLDDITPDMDWESFFKCKEMLDRYQVKPLIGVVPDNKDETLAGKEKQEHPEFWNYVKQLEEEGWSIAMHGFRHIYSTNKGGMFPLNCFSEFAGLSCDVQLSMLTEGKKLLEKKGIITDIFMAPAHSYDKNTLKALKKAGFTKVTDGFGNRPYRWKGLTFYPISFKLSSSLKKKTGFSTMVIHPATSSEEDFNRYESYLSNASVTWISYLSLLEQKPIERGICRRGLEFGMAALKRLLVGKAIREIEKSEM